MEQRQECVAPSQVTGRDAQILAESLGARWAARTFTHLVSACEGRCLLLGAFKSRLFVPAAPFRLEILRLAWG